MNNQTKKLISLAISGLIAGGIMTTTAFADHHEDAGHEEGKDGHEDHSEEHAE